MGSGGHTTVIRRVLENRSQPLRSPAPDTTATIAVMVRVMPPPRLLLSVGSEAVKARLVKALDAALVSVEVAESIPRAVQCLEEEPCHLLVTDSHELTRRVRKLRRERNPVVLFVLEVDDRAERQAALEAGADDCIGWRAEEEELHARVSLARRIAELETCLRTTLVENRKLSALDELTGLASRRFFIKHFPREVDRSSRYERALSLVVCDIDHFKRINDSFGHAAGDQVLQQFGRRLQAILRQGIDWIARIGGEEFVIVLPETAPAQATIVANKLRAAVADGRFHVDQGRLAVTASFGVCGVERVPKERKKIADDLLKRADAALYRAKHQGRNRVTAVALRESEDK
jgi:two-component system, cell cycle response regulator